MKKLVKIVEECDNCGRKNDSECAETHVVRYGHDFVHPTTRMSGNGSFPMPKQSDIGREVILRRRCTTWDGWLGCFADDPKQETYAFWNDEVR